MSLRSKITSCKTVDEVLLIDSMIRGIWEEEHPDVPLPEVSLDEIKRFALGLVD